ncbi:hypothetical protein ASG31_16620 [Chryseobacterium sp. Leaf404]|uniref:hypothetical protein n=1 Tax=unclassified Chryseobacterium TaxID=2593645 RepID=UPI0006F5A69C|nr:MULTISPECIES: hypothetical protein [unclassified Chryseobacterium]KQT21497.1 hypothetical protein ASG31_16620 [Chryseobacterium sp. Leaf404]
MKTLITFFILASISLLSAQSIRPGTYTIKLFSENKNINNQPSDNADLKSPCQNPCLEQIWILKIVRGKTGYLMLFAPKSNRYLTYIQIGEEKTLNTYIDMEHLLSSDKQHLQSFKIVSAGNGSYYIKPGDYDSYLTKKSNDRLYFEGAEENMDAKKWVFTTASNDIVPQKVIVNKDSPLPARNSVIVTPPSDDKKK